MAQPNGFWQNARMAAQVSPGNDQLEQILALVGQRDAEPSDIAELNSMPTAPLTGADRSPASFFPTLDGKPLAPAKNATKRHAVIKQPSQAPATTSDPNAASLGTYKLPFSDKTTEDQKRKIELQNRAFFLDPEEMKSRMAQLLTIPQFAEQEQGVKDQRDILAMEAGRPQPVDLSGLMGMADILSNGKYGLRSGYKSPEAPQARSKEQMANLDKAQDNQRDLTKSIVALANSGKAGLDSSTVNSLILSKIAEGFKTSPPPRPNGTGVNNADKWNKNTRADLAGDDKNAVELTSILGEVMAGNPIDDSRIAMLRAKADVGGRPNIAEVKQDAGSRALFDRAANAWSFLTTGNMSEKNRDLIVKSLYDLAEYRQAARNYKLERARLQGRKQYGLSDDQINSSLTTDYVNAYPKRANSETQVYQGKTYKYNPSKGPKSNKDAWEVVN